MKYSEAEKQIKALSSKYDIDMHKGDFNVSYNGISNVICVSDYCEYNIKVGFPEVFSSLPFSKNVYAILFELAMTPLNERVEEKKYYIHVLEGNKGYLNINDGKARFDNKNEEHGFKTKFTDKEINELKQRVDIPLDWYKVHFENAE